MAVCPYKLHQDMHDQYAFVKMYLLGRGSTS